MNTVSTGIAVALALVIVAFFFFPGLSPFRIQAPTEQTDQNTAAAAAATALDIASTTGPSAVTNQPTTMPSQEITTLQIKDTVVGTGVAAKAGDTVTVNYVGMLTNGKVFDASANHGSAGFSFTLGGGQVIKGWDQGIVGMKVGGKRELLIPAALAYGSQAVGGVIPANSPLIFEVELVKIGQ